MNVKVNSLQSKKRISRWHSVLGDAKHGNRMTFLTLILCFCYIAAALIFPSSEKTFHIITIILLMIITSWTDIRERQIPLSCLCGVLVINAVHSLFFYGNLITWAAGLLLTLLLMGFRLIKRDAIGTGDILLLGVLISTLPIEKILMFLFLSFFCSSITGILLVLVKRGSKSIVIPMAPCITLAFIAGTFIR